MSWRGSEGQRPARRGFGSRRFIPNPPGQDNCARAHAAMQDAGLRPLRAWKQQGSLLEKASLVVEKTSLAGGQTRFRGWNGRNYFAAGAVFSAACFLQSERNFLRSLPCRPLASASFEHSTEAAECTTGFLSIFAAGAAAGAGAVPCAKAAELISSTEANAVATAREERVIMAGTSGLKRRATSARDAEPRMNEAGRPAYGSDDI